MTSCHVKSATCNSGVLYSPAAIADSSSQPSHVVKKRHFSEHVKAMHEKRDCGFEKEFQVCLTCHMNPLNSTNLTFLSSIHVSPFILQTIATIPDGLMDIAKANSSKNRYHNIHTCESENAKVYDTCNADTELAGSYSLQSLHNL